MWNTDKEYMAGLRYIVEISELPRIDSDMGMGFFWIEFELLKTEYYPLGVVNKNFK
jgi:hypothetical protein